MQSFWALGTSTAFKVKFVILFICLFIYLFIYLFVYLFIYLFIYLFVYLLMAIPSKNKFSLFFQRSWNHKKHANILSEITFLEAHIWSISPI